MRLNWRRFKRLGFLCGFALAVLSAVLVTTHSRADLVERIRQRLLDERIETNAQSMLVEGRATFRDDTFGSESFWGDHLKLHRAIAGAPQNLLEVMAKHISDVRSEGGCKVC